MKLNVSVRSSLWLRWGEQAASWGVCLEKGLECGRENRARVGLLTGAD